jgi:hypothetical protein
MSESEKKLQNLVQSDNCPAGQHIVGSSALVSSHFEAN